MIKKIISFLLRMCILILGIIAFFQATAVLEGSSGLFQGLVIIVLCVLSLKNLIKIDNNLQKSKFASYNKNKQKRNNKLQIA